MFVRRHLLTAALASAAVQAWPADGGLAALLRVPARTVAAQSMPLA